MEYLDEFWFGNSWEDPLRVGRDGSLLSIPVQNFVSVLFKKVRFFGTPIYNGIFAQFFFFHLKYNKRLGYMQNLSSLASKLTEIWDFEFFWLFDHIIFDENAYNS